MDQFLAITFGFKKLCVTQLTPIKSRIESFRFF